MTELIFNYELLEEDYDEEQSDILNHYRELIRDGDE